MRGRTLAVWWAVTAGGLVTLAGPAAAAGPWVWPLDGPHTVNRPFDPPATLYGPGHRGADLPGLPGQPVRAAGAGRISYAGLLAGRGVVVVVHGDLRTTYEPVTAIVPVGRQVMAGEVIGRLNAGHPGCSPACLHWGLLRGEVYLDPTRLVRDGPSRLLPLDTPAAAALPLAARAAPVRPAAPVGPEPIPRPAEEPSFALRAADAASAGGALVALLAGLLLLRRPQRPPRPPRPPHHPATPSLAVVGPTPDPTPAFRSPQPARLVDLTSERRRRRPHVA